MKLQVFMVRRLLRGASGVVLIAGLGLAWPGCAAKKDPASAGVLEADKFLFEKATELAGRKKWIQSREYFRQIVDNYPQSSHRPDAKLGVGDTYLGEGSTEALVLGQNEFKEFLTFFPTHQRADYAQYQLGMSHHKQMLAAERDQTETREAIAEFTTFVERYPNSSLMADARARLREARSRLTESEYKVGFFYYRSKWYPGAIDRLKGVLASDPEYPARDAVYYYLAECMIKMGRKAEALPYAERIATEFEQSEYLIRAKQMADVLKKDLATDVK